MAFDADQYRQQYPFRSRFLDRGGLRYHYLDEGAGRPIVCVHGNPTWSFYFREVVKAFRDEYRVIVPDHIGCGLSDKPGDDRYEYVLGRRVDDLETLLDHLGLSSGVTLLVHDWGGVIGLACALRRPERIARLVVLNTAAFLPPGGKRLPWRLKIARDCRPLASVAIRGFNAFSYLATRVATTKGMPREIRKAYTAPYDSWANRIATLRFVQDVPLKPGDRSYAAAKFVDDNLHRFRGLPMLIVWGMRDFVFDADYLNEWRRRFPDADVHLLAHAGHYVLEDAPRETITLMRDFLTRHPIGPDGG